MASSQTDDTQLRMLHEQGHSQTEIARLLNIPRSTVRDRLKKLDQSPSPDTTPAMSTEGILSVYNSMFEGMMTDLHEIVAWWQERKAALRLTQDEGRETRRVTFFVEKRWEDAVRRQADLDNLTYTQIVNEAFRRYFEGK